MNVQINLNNDLMKKVDDYCAVNYMTRSGLVNLALTQFLRKEESFNILSDLESNIETIAIRGFVEEDELQIIKEAKDLCLSIIKGL